MLEKNSLSYDDDIYSIGLIFYNLKYLYPKEKLFLTKNKNNSRVYKTENININDIEILKDNKFYAGYYSLYNNDNSNIDETILENYSRSYSKNLNTSIESVYFSLIYLFQNHYIYGVDKVNKRKIDINKEFISKEPITQSLKLTKLNLIRNKLMEQNNSFSKYKETEIPPTK